MFNAPPSVIFTSQEASVGVQHQPVGAVSDGVGGDLIAVLKRFAADVVVKFLRGNLQSPVPRIVGVRFQHKGAAGSQRPVGINLYCVDLQTVGFVNSVFQEMVEIFLIGIDHGVDADFQDP